jgi:acetoin utilization deacetylase AcuC-like enzyme
MLKVAYSPVYKYQLPEGHRFPMDKYELLPEQLVHEGTLKDSNFFHPEMLSEEILLWTHDPEYWEKLKTQNLSRKEITRIGFPMNEKLIQRSRHISMGTTLCAQFALQYGISMNIAGGTHHSFADRGEGFCILNDIAIASNYLLKMQLANSILIVDLDVHQGNGTASIFKDEERVFTFSMHGEKNFPLHKERSSLDIGLMDKIGDKEYLNILKHTLPKLIDQVKPDFIFYLSGVDVLETDKLGRLGLSLQGCKERDRFVLQTCKDNQIPVAVSMGGGYSVRLWDIIEAHANTFRLAQEIYF